MPPTPSQLVIGTTPVAHFGAGSITALPDLISASGRSALVVTDGALAGTDVVATVTDLLAAARIPVTVFAGVHPNPTTADVDAGATAALELLAARPVVVGVGGGSPIDAAKGIALAAVNPKRGRELDYRSDFAVPALPLLAVPTTAGTGAETNAFGVVTDSDSRRKFYVGHATTMPVAAVLDPELTVGLPPGATAATGMDALTHAIESYLSVRANPWSAGIALQVVRMVSEFLPRACADGSDREARAQMLLAAHMAGIAMATTGLGAVHAIGHALGGRFDVAHGVALSLVLPSVLAFSLPVSSERLAELSVALGAGARGAGERSGGKTASDADGNASTAISAVAALAESVGLKHQLADFGITSKDFEVIAADALDDEVIANAPLQPSSADITRMLAAVA
jgi:alcohol dehydrogenase